MSASSPYANKSRMTGYVKQIKSAPVDDSLEDEDQINVDTSISSKSGSIQHQASEDPQQWASSNHSVSNTSEEWFSGIYSMSSDEEPQSPASNATRKTWEEGQWPVRDASSRKSRPSSRGSRRNSVSTTSTSEGTDASSRKSRPSSRGSRRNSVSTTSTPEGSVRRSTSATRNARRSSQQESTLWAPKGGKMPAGSLATRTDTSAGQEVFKLSAEELRDRLSLLGLPIFGAKPALAVRLLHHQGMLAVTC